MLEGGYHMFRLNKMHQGLLLGAALVTITSLSAATPIDPKKVSSDIKKMVETINKEGQDALCKKYGYFRSFYGNKCKNEQTGRLALLICAKYEERDKKTQAIVDKFMESGCGQNIENATWLHAIPESAFENQVIEGIKNEEDPVPDYIYLACTSSRDKLKGALKQIADQACPKK